MNQTVDIWLTRFAAGAGSQYEWKLYEIWVRERYEYAIRAAYSCTNVMCPLSAQATYETGQVFPVDKWRHAANLQHMMHWSTGGVIQKAADDDYEADPEVRARLFRICRLDS